MEPAHADDLAWDYTRLDAQFENPGALISGTRDAGIPPITRWPDEYFVIAMHASKQKLHSHPVVQIMAGRLSDHEIAVPAAYFATLD